MLKTIAFIPVRGGSKSITLKNIKPINKRPLIYWTLDAAVSCSEIEHIFVCTDSDDIKKCVMKYNHDKISVVGRSEEVSSDTASTESVMIEFAQNHEFEHIVLIQATSPMLTSNDLSRGMRLYKEDGIDSVLSGVRQKRFIWNKDGKFVTPLNYDPLYRPRRQEFEGYLVENGAFYITSKRRMLETASRISGRTAMLEMPEETYFELDEPSDWTIVEGLLRKREFLSIHSEYLYEKVKKIKAVFTDCDGVLTDGGMYYSEQGDELKKFNTRDGMAFQLLRERGYITGIITGENRELVKRRAMKMRVDEVHVGIHDKVQLMKEMMGKYNLKAEEIAYIGDDINDLEVIRLVGLGCSVSDGMDIVKQAASFVTKAAGGNGAVREIAELLLYGGKS
ncbi:HAD-IIIA family hydrolase [Paenibacillus dendritiformis]|uniref:HAD-IIIA family hydrolase n=1 Tax=Paenibacillus dendritiformis TaxID=130049 RepID=UPI00364DBD2D